MTKPMPPDARDPRVGGCSQSWSEKLPWYVNRTLSSEESSRVEGHLEACPDCRREVAELRLLQEAVRHRADEAPEPSEAVFQRVMERIEDYEASRFRPGRLYRALTSWLPSPELLWQPALRPAVAVVGLLLIVQAVAIAGLLTYGSPSREIRTLAGPPAARAPGPVAKIAFQAEATEEAIRSLLTEADASIVAGPSALGIYTVALPPKLEDEAAVDEALERLRARKDVVRFVERLP